MTPGTLLEILLAMPSDAPLVFKTEQGEIGGGYHVTEWKLSHINSIDCGARRTNWTESSLQLLDGEGDNHMTVGKFRVILNQSVAQISGLASATMHVEFAHRNEEKRIYQIETPELANGAVIAHLYNTRARCKPAQEAALQGTDPGCCRGGTVSSCCQ